MRSLRSAASLAPPTLVAITGRPAANASSCARLNPSTALVETNAFDAASNGAISSIPPLQWIAFLTNALGPVYRLWFYPPDLGSAEHPPFVREALRRKIEDAWSLVDAHLGAHGPYLLGADFSGADLLALMYMRWSRNMPKPVTAWPALRAYADRLRARPSWKRLYEIEGLTEWLA